MLDHISEGIVNGNEIIFSIHQPFNLSNQVMKLKLDDQSCQPLPVGELLLPWSFALLLEQSPSPSTALRLLWTRNDLLSASFVLVNALTILDLMLSRRTKPWRFFLRVLYRVSRSNVKWAFFYLFSYICLQVCSDQLMDIMLDAVRLPALTARMQMQMQHAWLTLRSHPILSTFSFAIFNLMVGWILHRLMPRNSIRNENHQRITGRVNNPGDRIPSRWSLLIECFFRPVSFATAHNLTDFDFELDDSMELLIERLALPNLWLTPVVPTDYLKYLPVWQYKGWKRNAAFHNDVSSESDFISVAANSFTSAAMEFITEEDSQLFCQVPSFASACNTDHPPSCTSWIHSCECAICLDKYRCAVEVCGLPCGHHFHHRCIMNWLQRDNHHDCPICRWPAYRSKCSSVI